MCDAGHLAMTRQLRVGVAGLGFGASIHVPGFRQIPGVEVVAICGRNRDRATEVARNESIQIAVSSVEELLDLGLDAISLALPPAGNTHGASLAIQRGVPVLCEKPLAIDPASAWVLATAAAPLTACVDFQFAELDAFRKTRELVTSGRFGTLTRVKVQWLTMSAANRTGAWSWKRDPHQDGGVMTLLGTHLLYLLEWMCGPVATLAGESFVRSPGLGIPVEATEAANSAELMFEFASGALGRATVSNAWADSRVHSWQFVFEEATITLQNDTNDYMRGFRVTTTDQSGAHLDVLDTSSTEADGRLAPFVRLASRFVSAVRAGESVKPDFSDAARVAELAALVHPRA
jgi:predicted dehydrogenase